MKNMSVAQIKELIGELQNSLREVEEKIEERVQAMHKAVKKNDLSQVRFLNNMIRKHFEHIDQLKNSLTNWEFELKKAEVVETEGTGFAVVVEYLEDIYEKDIEWFRELQEKSYDELKQESKVVRAIAQMSEEEAIKMFRNDLINRFYKLVTSVKKKAGENILECKLKRNENEGLDGWVRGDKKRVTLTTIGAGGYNIQRFHYRTLIK